ncbi:MAG TPA: hypothetical protein VIH27_06085 [Nitrososphaerales archaeon]
MTQEIKVPNSKIKSSQTGLVTIQETLVGPINMSQVILNGFKGDFKYSSGTMKNTEIKIVIKPYIDYWWGVCIDFYFDSYCVGDSGTVSLGTIDTGWSSLGNVLIDGGQLLLDVAKTSFGPFKMTPLPIGGKEGGIAVSSIQTDNITMKDTSMSTGLQSVLGIDLPIPNPMGPQSTQIKDTVMERFQSQGIRIPPMTFRDIQSQNIKMDKSRTGGFNATGSFTKSTSWVDLTFIGFRLRFDISSTLKASELIMNDLSGDVKINSATTSGFSMTMDMRGIDIKDLKINNFQIPTIVLEV